MDDIFRKLLDFKRKRRLEKVYSGKK
jgi:hypothetical protein